MPSPTVLTDLPLHAAALPPQQAGAERPPLLIVMHGFGASENDLLPLGHMIDPRLRVVACRAPIDLTPAGMPGGFAWFPLMFSPAGIDYDREAAQDGAEIAQDFIRAAQQYFETPAARTMVLGFSQGAMMAHVALLEAASAEGARSADLPFAAAACCSGRDVETVFTERDLSSLAGFPLFVSHGVHDEVITIESGRNIRDYYQASPASLTYHEYNMAHGIDPDCMADLQAWAKPIVDAMG